MGMEPLEIIWKQYEKHIELYKFYLDLVIKVNAFHFAICGAIFSFYFANRAVPDAKWALLLPALLSFCLTAFFCYGAIANLVSRSDVFELRGIMGLKVAPDLMVLTVFLGIFSLGNLLTFFGAIYIMFIQCV